MSVSQEVKLKNGQTKTVYAADDTDLKEAVKVAQGDEAPVYPNINRPVQKGHDLVATGSDVSKVLVDGTGAHNSPNDAVNPFSTETDSKVEVAGMDEPRYKSVPAGGNQDSDPRTATDSEVSKAKGDAEPANEVQAQEHNETRSSSKK